MRLETIVEYVVVTVALVIQSVIVAAMFLLSGAALLALLVWLFAITLGACGLVTL